MARGSFLGSFQDSMISRILGKAWVTAMRREGRQRQGRQEELVKPHRPQSHLGLYPKRVQEPMKDRNG